MPKNASDYYNYIPVESYHFAVQDVVKTSNSAQWPIQFDENEPERDHKQRVPTRIRLSPYATGDAVPLETDT